MFILYIKLIILVHMKKQKSPCIDICKFIGPNGWCLGCAGTREEARKWKKLKPYDIKIMHKTLQRRMETINNSS